MGGAVATDRSASIRAWIASYPRAVCTRLSISRRDMLVLVALGIVARGLTATLVHYPGYIDAAYYYAVARNVAAGRGLTEDFIITYLVPAAHVAHPSNLYWMPGASLILVPFLWLFGGAWWAALIPNVLLTGALPALAYSVGREVVGTRRVAMGAGLLTLTAGFYYPFYDPLPDNFGLYAWTAGGALLLISQGVCGRPRRFALAGLCIGLAHLARAEAPILIAIAAVVWAWTHITTRRSAGHGEESDDYVSNRGHSLRGETSVVPLPLWSLGVLLGLYLLTMAPWFVRNLLLVGSPLPQGGFQIIWLRSYNDFFSFGQTYSPSSYFAWGIGPIVGSKLNALASNALQLTAVLEFVLAPLALLGAWRLRRNPVALPWLLYALGAYLVLSLVLTFPGANGGLLHTEVAALPFLFVAVVVGLDSLLDWLGRRGGRTSAGRTAERKRVYLGAAIGLSVILSTFIILANVRDWDTSAAAYAHAGRVVASDVPRLHSAPVPRQSAGDTSLPVVMVENPSFYYVVTGQRAVAIPNQGLAEMSDVARRYGAHYLVLEPLHSPAQNGLWVGTERTPLLTLLWSSPAVRVFRWNL